MNIKAILSRECNNIRSIKLYNLKFNDIKEVKPKLQLNIMPINNDNYLFVRELRDKETADSFKDMLEHEEIGLFAYINDKPIAHAWAAAAVNKTILKDYARLPAKSCYIHYCYVEESLRGNNIYPFLLYSLMQNIHDKYAIEDYYVFVDYDNKPSQSGISKLGFKCIKEANILNILGKAVNKIYI
jgi:RimJ/RimL family protein N-acetyltransferase